MHTHAKRPGGSLHSLHASAFHHGKVLCEVTSYRRAEISALTHTGPMVVLAFPSSRLGLRLNLRQPYDWSLILR